MFNKEEILRIEKKVDEMAEKIRLISERQNAQYTDIVLKLRELRDEVIEKQPEDTRTLEEMFDEVKSHIIKVGKASTAYLQRKFKLGYARAAKLMEMLEEKEVIGESEGAKPRKVLQKSED